MMSALIKLGGAAIVPNLSSRLGWLVPASISMPTGNAVVDWPIHSILDVGQIATEMRSIPIWMSSEPPYPFHAGCRLDSHLTGSIPTRMLARESKQ
jgi:hypothetical protein